MLLTTASQQQDLLSLQPQPPPPSLYYGLPGACFVWIGDLCMFFFSITKFMPVLLYTPFKNSRRPTSVTAVRRITPTRLVETVVTWRYTD